MNRRMKKKVEERKREQIHRLLDLALDINGLEPRSQTITGNLPTVFFEFYGHVGLAEIRVYSAGWASGKDPDVDMYMAACSLEKLSNVVHRMEALKAETPGAATPRESR